MADFRISQRALDLEQQLQSLQHELQSPADVGDAATPKLPVEDARRLKRVVDDFRLFLWAYADTWGEKHGDAAGTLQRIKLQAIADMLNLLRPELAGKGLPEGREASALRQAFKEFSRDVMKS